MRVELNNRYEPSTVFIKEQTKCCLGPGSSVANRKEIRKQDQNKEGNGYNGKEFELILHATSPPLPN